MHSKIVADMKEGALKFSDKFMNVFEEFEREEAEHIQRERLSLLRTAVQETERLEAVLDSIKPAKQFDQSDRLLPMYYTEAQKKQRDALQAAINMLSAAIASARDGDWPALKKVWDEPCMRFLSPAQSLAAYLNLKCDSPTPSWTAIAPK